MGPTAIIGCGTLGLRIALMLASAGGEVRLYNRTIEKAESGRRWVAAELSALVASRPGAVAGQVVVAPTLAEAVAGTWLVVESVAEHRDLKRAIFAELDRLAPIDAVLASNSSSFPSSQLIDGVSRVERVVNTHFYMPPELNVVEIMSCGRTDEAVIELLLRRLPTFGLEPFLVSKESMGFIFNRIWAALKREALAVVAEGVSNPQEVDRLFQILIGASAGPFRLMDKVGLDVALAIEEHYAAAFSGLPPGPRELLRRYVDQGWLGRKSGKGFYADYE